MFIVTGKEMAEIDKIASRDWQIPEVILMENAGLRVVEEINNQLGKMEGKKVVIIAGKGNNGGDGLVIARHLCNQGAEVKVFLLGKKEYEGAALANYKMAQKLPIKWHVLENENSLHLLKLTLHYADIIVDALFGTGFKGTIKGLAVKVIETCNESNGYKFSVDVPSGLNADTGEVSGPCIRADFTVTFALPKLGLLIQPGIDYTGQLKVVDISIPSKLITELGLNKTLLTKELIKNNLPLRTANSHKGSYGHLLIIGGSLGMMGAVHLAGNGGFALGAGLVSAAVPRSIQASLAGSFPELITHPLAETPQGTLGFISGPDILNCLEGKTALVFGPGIGKHNEIIALLKWLANQLTVPLIIDADGLNTLAQELNFLKEVKIPVILTPHPGEMARLLGVSVQEVQTNRLDLAQALAEDYGVWVVLKGNKTVITTPQGEIYLNPSGGPALATAGTGDVLAGMIGAMVGQTQDITQAICTAVYLHGLAGEYVAAEVGDISSRASDLIKAIPQVIKKEFSYGN